MAVDQVYEDQQKMLEACEMREEELARQVASVKESLEATQHSSDTLRAQLFEAQTKLEELRSAKASQLEMASEDVERNRIELEELRRRCHELTTRTGAEDHTESHASNASVELAAKDVQISQMAEKIALLEESLSGQSAQKAEDHEKIRSQLAEKEVELAELREKLISLPTIEEYQELLQRTETLKALQLDGGGVDESGTDMESGLTLEKKLLNRLKAIEAKLTKSRNEHMEKDSELVKLRKQCENLEEQLTDQKVLVKKLEEGISSMTGENGTDRDAGLSFDLRSHEDRGEDMTMLNIITGQRDRFRARVQDLEQESRKLVERLERLQGEQDAMKADNVQLYAQIRYLQSYKNGSSAGESLPTVSEEDNSFLSKYRSIYEDTMNPFTVFNRRERHRRINELSTAER